MTDKPFEQEPHTDLTPDTDMTVDEAYEEVLPEEALKDEPDKIQVWTYNIDDYKIFSYRLTEQKAQLLAEIFDRDIMFLMTDEEASEFAAIAPINNLKEDFIYFKPSVAGMHKMICTCNNFYEAEEPTERGMNSLAKKALRHARKTGHTINPRGN